MRTTQIAPDVVHLTTDQLAQRWNMLVESSAPPHLKIGRSVRFALAAVQAFEEANTFSSTKREAGREQ